MWGNKWGASGYQVQSCHFKIVLQNILPPAASNLSSEGDSEHMTKKYTYDSYEFIWHIFKEDLSINLSIHPPIHDLSSLIALSYQCTTYIQTYITWLADHVEQIYYMRKTTSWSKTNHKYCRSRIERTKCWQLTRWIDWTHACRSGLD